MEVKEIIKLAEAEALSRNEYYEPEDYLDDNCFRKFPMYYSGWECDSNAWVMSDGTIFGTNHGQLCITSIEEFETYRNQMTKVSEDLDDLADEITKLIKG